MRFTVASLVVRGNADQGWDVSSRHSLGSINVSEDVVYDDDLLLNVLNETGYADDFTSEDYEVHEEGDDLTIVNWQTGRPVLALIAGA